MSLVNAILLSTSLLLQLQFTSTFQLVSYYPSTSNASSFEGGSVLLGCQSDSYIRSCTWRHRDKFCRLEYSRTARGLVKNACIVYKERIFVHGDYEQHECVIELREVDMYDHGLWTCHLEEYVNKLNLLKKAKRIQHTIRLDVVPYDEKVNRDSAPSEQSPYDRSRDTSNENVHNEATWHLILAIAGTVAFLLALGTIVALTVAILKRAGLFRDSRRQGKRLSFVLDSQCSDINPEEVSPQEVEASEKARAKLGLQMSYSSSRRVL